MIVRVAVGPARSARSNDEAHVRPLIYGFRVRVRVRVRIRF